jgi:hypothetical protein
VINRRINLRPGSGYELEKLDSEKAFAYGEGRMFDRWIDTINGSARSNGYSEGDLIANPAYIIESVIRDEILTERDLVMGTPSGRDAFPCTGLISSTDDYYNNAVVYRVTDGAKDYVSNFIGSGQTIELSGAGNPAADGEKFYLTNIQGDNKVDYASFDRVGNTTDGLRKDWIFGRCLNTKQSSSDIVEQLLFESSCILFRSYNAYKLVALDEDSGSVDTWTEPMKDRETKQEIFQAALTPLENVYSDFRLNYFYDYGSGTYKKQMYVNAKSMSSNATILDPGVDQQKCIDAETNYKIRNRKFEYNADWIYDDNTAEYLLKKLILALTVQRLIITWGAPIKTHIKYEVGDQVILNNDRLLPTGVSNTSKFMIFSRKIRPIKGAPYVMFNLIMPGSVTGGYGYDYGNLYGTGL